MMKAAKHVCTRGQEIDVLKDKIDDIHKSIVGNGKPGLNSDMRLVMNIINGHNERICKVEKNTDNLNVKMAYYAGVVAVIVFLITWLPKWM